MAKPELGTKRLCPSCATKYYDLGRSPITCPNCGTVFEIAAVRERAPRAAVAAPVAVDEEVETEAVLDRDPELVSLEDVEEDAEPDIGPDADEDEAVIADPIEIEPDDTDDDTTFLPEEEEEGDDVADLLGVDGEDEEEV